MTSESRTAFARICADVRACTRCPRMAASARILSAASGSLNATAMFIAEAPGRLGADRTAIPLHGDVAGDNFERLLSAARIDRYSVYVTNAVLCNPRDPRGNNATPTRTEMDNCAVFLKAQIELVNPRLVVSLGARALEALEMVEPHGLQLGLNAATQHEWYGRKLVPLYHPGMRAMIHRPFARQLEDYRFLRSLLPGATEKVAAIEVARAIMAAAGRPLSYFALHKLFYLCEVAAVRAQGSRLTSAFIIRQQNGPYVTDLHIKKLARALPELRTWSTAGELLLSLTRGEGPSLFSLPNEALQNPLITTVLAKYGRKSDAELKVAAYLTTPMKAILRQEKAGGMLLNQPIEL